jgi:ABC-type branched-subunit amino acid transport system ATPase component/ABC-type branched-subunit amino acid transport system permease subunit
MIATWITPQVVLNGTVNGLVIALVAMGLVLTYRATRVINFAVGNMGLPAAALLVVLVVNHGLGYWTALLVSLLAGAAFALGVELVVVRRLFRAPRVILLVATIGVAQLAQGLVLLLPDVQRRRGSGYPVPVDAVWEVGDLRVSGPQLTVVLVVPLLALGLGLFLERTTFGRTVAASADNPDLARLSGISPRRVSSFVWVVAGVLAGISIILLSGLSGSPIGITDLGATTLNRALVVAVLAGLRSFPRTVVAGIAVGVMEAAVRFNVVDQPGLIDLLLLVAVVIAVALAARGGRDEVTSWSFAPQHRPVPAALAQRWWVRHLGTLGGAAAFAAAALLPLVVTQPSRHLLYSTVVAFAVVTLSIVVITGWAGQLSLGQMAFAGMGALFAAGLQRGLTMEPHLGGWRLFALELPALPWVVAAAGGVVFAAAVAVAVGVTALRVQGLLLAVSTFAFALAAQQWFYRQPLLSGGRLQSVPVERGELWGVDLSEQRSYYWLALGLLAVAVAAVARLRRTGVGRATIAVRENPEAAAAYTVGAARQKLVAFALAGGLAGLGGILLAGAIGNVPLTERFFQVDDSLAVVAMAVIGGLGSVSGALIGALWVVGLPAFFPDSSAVPFLVSGVGLLLLLLYFPGGLVQLGFRARDALLAWLSRRSRAAARTAGAPAGAAPGSTGSATVATTTTRPPTGEPRSAPVGEGPPTGRPAELPALVVADVSVRFGGNVAVDGVNLDVSHREVVGLIGTNGAGKSTLLDAIGGFVPATGRVLLEGRDLSRAGPATRARAGLGRTFQAARLFPELTLHETVMVALEARGRSGFWSSALALPASVRRERVRRSEADDLLDLLGLGPLADRRVGELSTGTRRVAELACLLALGARVLCLDEPTAGVAQRDAEAFGPLLREVADDLGAAMVVIEHDLPLIMGLSDRVYCLDLGRVIAEGPPEQVRDDPAVVAAYLGTAASAPG